MRKLLVLPVVAALAVVPAADAAKKGKKKQTVKINTTVQAHTVNGQGLIAGALSDSALGPGATVYQTSMVGSSGGVTTENVTFQAWVNLGSIKGSGTIQVKTSGTPITFTGTGQITGGTGRYKGAKGALTFTGSFDGANDVNISATGSFTYTG